MNLLLCIRCACASWFSFLLLSGLSSPLRGQSCAFLPPGGPIGFGLVEVGRFENGLEAGDSPMWMDDGRTVIGSSQNSGVGYRRGAVLIFSPYTSKFSLESTIYPPIPEIGTFGAFGRHLATSGPWLAVWAQKTDDQGIICMYQQTTNATGLEFRTNLVGTGTSGERLGDGVRGLAMHGRWLAAIRYGDSGGAIYMYRVNDAGVWEEKQRLIHPEYPTSIPNDAKVDIFGRTLVFTYAASGLSSGTGRADVWRLDDDGVWNYETELVPEGLTDAAHLGSGFDVAEDLIFLSASSFEKTATNGGGIFIYKRVNGQWTEESRITAAGLGISEFIGNRIAYSDFAGEYLAEATGNLMRMFRRKGDTTEWELISRGQPGRSFKDWESPAGNIDTYSYGSSPTILHLSARSYQVLTGFRTFSALHEHGTHSIQTRHFSGDPECMRRPVYWVPIGAPRDDNDQRAADLDSDGIADLAEIYFGTYLDEANQLSAALQPTAPDGQRKVQWARSKEPGLRVTGHVEWSSDLATWTTEGITETKLGEDEAGREIMETTLPPAGSTAYLRLVLTLTPEATQETF